MPTPFPPAARPPIVRKPKPAEEIREGEAPKKPLPGKAMADVMRKKKGQGC